MKKFRWTNLLKGGIFLAVGIILLCTPGLALSSIAFLLGLAVTVAGVKDIVIYVKARRHIGSGLTAILAKGIIGSLTGVLLLANPMIGTWILNVIVPIGLIAYYAFRIASYGLVKRIAGKVNPLLILCLNTLGLMLGILMLFNPMLFTMSFGILAGGILIVFGVSSVLEAFSHYQSHKTSYEDSVWQA